MLRTDSFQSVRVCVGGNTQNPVMIGVGRGWDLWRSSSAISPPIQVHLEQVAWDSVYVGFE